MWSPEVLIVIGAFVLIVALYAIAKGRGFKFSAQRGKNKVELGVTEKKEVSPEPSGGAGSISDVKVLDQGKIQQSENVNIHIGHSSEKKKD